MLPNRVDPLGNIIRTTARGAWMGNRGLLHGDQQDILRAFKWKAWLTCRLEFKGWKRQVMTPNRYTELFFLDEATAFSAGHRPCAECRRMDFNRFKSCWLEGNPEYTFTERTSIREIDEVLHKERIDRAGVKQTFEESVVELPNGCFVLHDGMPFLLADGLLYAWSPFGYAKGQSLPATKKMTVLTPGSVVRAFRAGYQPQISAISKI
jgi:hypothetical protein